MRVLVLRVFDDADDLEVVLMAVAIAAEILADWVLNLEKLLREPFIDNGDPRATIATSSRRARGPGP